MNDMFAWRVKKWKNETKRGKKIGNALLNIHHLRMIFLPIYCSNITISCFFGIMSVPANSTPKPNPRQTFVSFSGSKSRALLHLLTYNGKT